jgi:hypothetical protein
MVVVFDNRRMGAISSLQQAQYHSDFGTNDSLWCVKESDFGREGGQIGILDYLEPQYIKTRHS